MAEDDPTTSGSNSPDSGAPDPSAAQDAPAASAALPAPGPSQAPIWWAPTSPTPTWQSPYAAPGAWRTPSWQAPSPVPGQAPAGYGPAGYGPFIGPDPGPPPPSGPGPGFKWGGVGFRFGALVVDAMLVVGLEVVLSVVMVMASGGRSASGANSSASTAVSVIWLIFALMYHPACWYVFGATVGQKAFGLRVAQASNGQALGIGAVLVRYTIFSVVTVLFPLGIISAIVTTMDPFKRAWHDKVSRSIVVRRGW